jgi:hypothetical protein
MGTEMEKIMRRVELACILLLASTVSTLAQTESEALARASKFADQVVRVIPEYTDGRPAPTGFGLVVGERVGKVYIATPQHVAFGKERASLLGPTPGVVFRGERYTTIQARRLEVASPTDDLAVLEVTPPQGLTLPLAPVVLASQLQLGSWVWNIGIGQNWDTPYRAGGLVERTPSPVGAL